MARKTEEQTKAAAAANVLAVAAEAAANVAARQVERIDHDGLIRLEAQVATLTQQMQQTATEQTRTSARLEEKVDKINGSVGRHDQILRDMTMRPELPAWLTAEVVAQGVNEHRQMHADWQEQKSERPALAAKLNELWDIYRLGRWLLAALVIMQPVEIFLIVRFAG
jgi:hypothetical protein